MNSDNELLSAFSDNNVPVIFASDDNYAPYLGVALQSLLEHSSKDYNYDIIIFDDSIREDYKYLLLKQVSYNNNVSIRFYDVSNCFKEHNISDWYHKGHLSQAMYARIFCPLILKNFSKIIYLDCDIIIRDGLENLYYIDMRDSLLCAALDKNPELKRDDVRNYLINILELQNPKTYFNSGVLVMNISQMIKENIFQKCKEVASKNFKYWHDQNLLNAACQNRVTFLADKWNFFANENDNVANETPLTQSIIHYAGIKKWSDPNFKYADIFWEYARRSLFYEIIQNTLQDKNAQKHVSIKTKPNISPAIVNKIAIPVRAFQIACGESLPLGILLHWKQTGDFIFWGPYLPLPAGGWEVCFSFEVNPPLSTAWANTRIFMDIVSDKGRTVYFQGEFAMAQLPGLSDIFIRVDSSEELLEFRLRGLDGPPVHGDTTSPNIMFKGIAAHRVSPELIKSISAPITPESRLAEADARLLSAENRLAEADARLLSVYRSRSWRITRPLRGIIRVLHRDYSFFAALKKEFKEILKPPLLALIRLARRYEIVNTLALNCLRWTPRLKVRLRALEAANQTSSQARSPSISLFDMSPREQQFHDMIQTVFEAECRKRKA
jgi:lipopolysaccharide biosynthesis glycosyltransferase